MDVKSIPSAALPVTNLTVPPQLKKAEVAAAKSQAAIKKVASEFETMFVNLMLKSMRSTVGEDKLTGGGHGEEVYRSILDEQYAIQAAKTGSLGLAAMIERQLSAHPALPPAAQDGAAAAASDQASALLKDETHAD